MHTTQRPHSQTNKKQNKKSTTVHLCLAEVEPRRAFSGPLHYPLVLVDIPGRLTLVQHNGLRGGRVQGLALHGVDDLADLARLPAHLGVAVPTQGVLLLQMATLQARLNVCLRGKGMIGTG